MKTYVLYTNDGSFWYGYWEDTKSVWYGWHSTIADAVAASDIEYTSDNTLEEFRKNAKHGILYESTTPISPETHPEYFI